MLIRAGEYFFSSPSRYRVGELLEEQEAKLLNLLHARGVQEAFAALASAVASQQDYAALQYGINSDKGGIPLHFGNFLVPGKAQFLELLQPLPGQALSIEAMWEANQRLQSRKAEAKAALKDLI